METEEPKSDIVKRSEARRRKLLMSQEERMSRILGVSKPDSEATVKAEKSEQNLRTIPNQTASEEQPTHGDILTPLSRLAGLSSDEDVQKLLASTFNVSPEASRSEPVMSSLFGMNSTTSVKPNEVSSLMKKQELYSTLLIIIIAISASLMNVNIVLPYLTSVVFKFFVEGTQLSFSSIRSMKISELFSDLVLFLFFFITVQTMR